MSSWSMNDGSALTGTYTFTNASAIVQGNSSADTSEIKVGDIVIDDNGDKVRVANLQPTRTVATSAVNASNEQITITNHGFVANTPLVYRAGGGTAIAGTGISDGGTVFVRLFQVPMHLLCLQLLVVHRLISLVQVITHSRSKELLLKRLLLLRHSHHQQIVVLLVQ